MKQAQAKAKEEANMQRIKQKDEVKQAQAKAKEEADEQRAQAKEMQEFKHQQMLKQREQHRDLAHQ